MEMCAPAVHGHVRPPGGRFAQIQHDGVSAAGVFRSKNVPLTRGQLFTAC